MSHSLSPSRIIASGFGSGLAPFSPGTFGSAAATLVWIGAISAVRIDPRLIGAALLTATVFAGFPATSAALRQESRKDPSWIVVDEWAGMFLLFAVAPQSDLIGILLGFGLFRFFDILKPGPVGWAERLKGSWGVMADDLVAGFVAALVLLAVR